MFKRGIFYFLCLVLLYGLIASWFGVVGYLHPCNIKTKAKITSCTPDSTLGFFIFNVSYQDINNNIHTGQIKNDTITCFHQSLSYSLNITQYMDICYEVLDPSKFHTNDYVLLKNPHSAKYLLITGIPSIIIPIICLIILSTYVHHLIRTNQLPQHSYATQLLPTHYHPPIMQQPQTISAPPRNSDQATTSLLQGCITSS